MVYKNREDIGYCYIAKKPDDTDLIYYADLKGILNYVDKTIKENK